MMAALLGVVQIEQTKEQNARDPWLFCSWLFSHVV